MQKTIVLYLKASGTYEDDERNRHSNMVKAIVDEKSFNGGALQRASALEKYNANIAAMQAEIAPERLLTVDVLKGWGHYTHFWVLMCRMWVFRIRTEPRNSTTRTARCRENLNPCAARPIYRSSPRGIW